MLAGQGEVEDTGDINIRYRHAAIVSQKGGGELHYVLCWRCNLSGQIFHKSIAYKRFSKKDKKGLSLTSSVYSRDLTSSVSWSPCFSCELQQVRPGNDGGRERYPASSDSQSPVLRHNLQVRERDRN